MTIIFSIFFNIYISQGSYGTIINFGQAVYYVGLSLIILGILIRWTAIFKLKKVFTVKVSIQQDHKIIDTGIYKIIRHPAYSGSLHSFLGLGLALFSWLSIFVIFLPILGAFMYSINIEEIVLESEFGKDYINYSNNTKRIIPWIY